MTRKPRVVTFRLDQATWDFMREIVPYTRYRNTSSFIRAAHPYLPQSQTLRIILPTACQENFFSRLLGRVDGFDQDEAECERDEGTVVEFSLLTS